MHDWSAHSLAGVVLRWECQRAGAGPLLLRKDLINMNGSGRGGQDGGRGRQSCARIILWTGLSLNRAA